MKRSEEGKHQTWGHSKGLHPARPEAAMGSTPKSHHAHKNNISAGQWGTGISAVQLFLREICARLRGWKKARRIRFLMWLWSPSLTKDYLNTSWICSLHTTLKQEEKSVLLIQSSHLTLEAADHYTHNPRARHHLTWFYAYCDGCCLWDSRKEHTYCTR